jgi:ABC-2 type transport system ATP-binding protein
MGVDVGSEKTARDARRHIGYLPQGFSFDPAMKLRDFVAYGAWIRGVPSRDWASASAEVLAYVELLDQARRKMGSLSSGMRQRAGIAWALVGRPNLVLLDEPTVGLDPQQRLRFRELLAGLTDTAVLLSTHLTDDVDAVCDRVVVMSRGEIIFQGRTEDLKALAATGSIGHTPIERSYMTLIGAQGHEQ